MRCTPSIVKNHSRLQSGCAGLQHHAPMQPAVVALPQPPTAPQLDENLLLQLQQDCLRHKIRYQHRLLQQKKLCLLQALSTPTTPHLLPCVTKHLAPAPAPAPAPAQTSSRCCCLRCCVPAYARLLRPHQLLLHLHWAGASCASSTCAARTPSTTAIARNAPSPAAAASALPAAYAASTTDAACTPAYCAITSSCCICFDCSLRRLECWCCCVCLGCCLLLALLADLQAGGQQLQQLRVLNLMRRNSTA